MTRFSLKHSTMTSVLSFLPPRNGPAVLRRGILNKEISPTFPKLDGIIKTWQPSLKSNIMQGRLFATGGKSMISEMFSSTIMSASLPAVFITITLWTVLMRELKYDSAKKIFKSSQQSATANTNVRSKLQLHYQEKLQLLRKISSYLILVLVMACLKARTFPWDRKIYLYGPSAALLGKNFAFWASEVTMDACLDECSEYKTQITKAVALLTMIVLVINLTSRTGHMIFVLKACESICSTLLGRTMDHFNWVCIALTGFITLTGRLLFGGLPLMPLGIESQGVWAYSLITIGTSPIYQIVQNRLKVKCRTWHVWMIREFLLGFAVVFLKTPTSWVLYDITNFVVFLCFKSGVDLVALFALNRK